MASFRLIFRPDAKYGALGGSWIEVCPRGGPEGQPVITHDCSPVELEHEINALKTELDAVLRKAKAKSAAHMRAKSAQREDS